MSKSIEFNQQLKRAWYLRIQLGIFDRSQANRVFYGPGEGEGGLESYAVDRFLNHYWVTEWENQSLTSALRERVRKALVEFLRSQGAESIVGLGRPQKGVAPVSEFWWGSPPAERVQIEEFGIPYGIQLVNTRHPGLFLDHAPLRAWLTQSMRGLKVLNTFSYTGSLSIAAARGGASHVTTLDLSQATIQWAKDNAILNSLDPQMLRWISGDVFEWLPRLKKEKQTYDCIILDPPSFSHGKGNRFSTSKDLTQLHLLAMDLLNDGGYLVTSINSENVSWNKYESDVLKAAQAKRFKFQVVSRIDLPPSFPTRLDQNESRYLKGWILKRIS